MQLKDRTAIVTGAASGIGKAIALRFAEEGAHVIVADRTDEPREGGEKTLDLIRSVGGDGAFVEMDVASWDSVDAGVGFAVSRYGALDIIVNNAAIGSCSPNGTRNRVRNWRRSTLSATGSTRGPLRWKPIFAKCVKATRR